MKKSIFKIIVNVLIVLFVTACSNDSFTSDNFDYTASYFGWQYPVRTLVLGGSDYYDTSNDLKHQFEIKASLAGVSVNSKDRNVIVEIDPSLVDSLAFNNGTSNVRLQMLPSNYYEPLSTTTMVIPAGSFNGGILIKLTEAFFNDPLAASTKYVLPIRIKSADTDSIIKGKYFPTSDISLISSIASKWKYDPRIASNWEVQPKNFTIYAIKYVNKFNGYYLKRGTEKETTIGVSSTEKGYGWEKKYIEYTTFIPKLSTVSLSKILYADKLALTSAVKFSAIIDVASDNSVTISKDPSSTTSVSGTGQFTVGIEEWGGKKRNAFYLSYTVSDPSTNKTYAVKDTLVIRDNAVAVETYSPVIIP